MLVSAKWCEMPLGSRAMEVWLNSVALRLTRSLNCCTTLSVLTPSHASGRGIIRPRRKSHENIRLPTAKIRPAEFTLHVPPVTSFSNGLPRPSTSRQIIPMSAIVGPASRVTA